MADKDKSVLDKFVDTFQEVVGSVVKGAVTPTEKTDESRVAGSANEQVYIPEATDAAAMPAPIVRRKAPAKRANKRTAKAAPANKAKTAKKAAAKRTAPKKSKSSAGRKAVGRKTTAKKAAKKKARKSRR